MSETKNLKLFKHDEPLETNENKFNIDLALNQNWDKIEEFADMVNDKIIEIEDKDEEQDFNLQELQNEIKKDRENMINLEVEGQSIHIEDSSDLEGKLEVLGNVEQETRGKNLLNNTAKTTTVNGVTFTVNEDGTVIANGTATSLAQISLVANVKLPAGTYTIKDGKAYVESVDFNGWSDGLNNPSTLTFNTEVLLKNVYIQIKQGETVSNKTFYPQIEKGTKATEYEQYIEKAIPEHNSEIRAVGDNINLLENTAKTQIINGVEFTVNPDKTIKINGTATENISTDITKNFAITEQSIFSGMCDGYGYNKMLIQIQGTDYNVNIPNSTPQVLQPKDNVKVRVYIYAGTSINNAIIRPKIEKGTVVTSYSEFGQGSVEIKKINKNLAPNLKDGKLEKQSTFICNCKKGESFTLSVKGTAEIDNRLSLRTNVNFAESIDEYVDQETLGLNGTQQKMTITSTIDGILYIRAAANVKRHNIEYLQIENEKVATEIVEHQEQTKILPIQEPMLEGDHFNRIDNKEVHTWKKIILDGVNNKVTQETTATNGKYRYKYTDKDLKNCSLSEEKAYCTHLQLIEKNKTYDKIVGFTVSNGSLLIYTDGDTAVNFNAKLQKENYIFYIPVIESAYQNLDLTPKQIEVLDQLDNLETYKTVTNITTDSIAKLKLKYIADTKTYIDNKTSNLEQQVNTINQLLSTTKTSAKLLDNLQSDIESEVL